MKDREVIDMVTAMVTPTENTTRQRRTGQPTDFSIAHRKNGLYVAPCYTGPGDKMVAIQQTMENSELCYQERNYRDFDPEKTSLKIQEASDTHSILNVSPITLLIEDSSPWISRAISFGVLSQYR